MGLKNTYTIARIVVDSKNPDVVYVAASGHEWTPNKERGVYKTVDGGKSWNPVNKGLPEAKFRGRIGIDIARSNPNVLYAYVDNYEIAHKFSGDESDSYGRPKGGVIKGATVYRTSDKGDSWQQVSGLTEKMKTYMERHSATYGWVFGQIRVDPNDENTIYTMGLALNVSTDGGKTFKRLRVQHGDHHGLWIDPNNSSYLVNTNDGGAYISYDKGKTWRSFTDRLHATQFFNIGYDMDEPFHVYGSIQDIGSMKGVVDLSRGRDHVPSLILKEHPVVKAAAMLSTLSIRILFIQPDSTEISPVPT